MVPEPNFNSFKLDDVLCYVMTSFFGTALKTDAAKQAYGTGLVNLLETNNLDQGIDAMFNEAEKNGSLQVARFALGLDILKAIADEFEK